MRRILQLLFRRPIAILANYLSSSPNEKDVFYSLSKLLSDIRKGKKKKGFIQSFDYKKDRFIIFSDQHKGNRDPGDDFQAAEPNYLAALGYYADQQYYFVSLGDCEELWKYHADAIMDKNRTCFEAEKKFMATNRYCRIFGNHDLIWKYKLQQNLFLKPVFGSKIKVYEGLILETSFNQDVFSFFLAHGHQGDTRNDGNPFSVWVVANIWTPIQRYLRISINTPATSFELTDKHNIIMYNWAATQDNLIFISGHTHKPVFASLDHLDRLAQKLTRAKNQQDHAAVLALESELKDRSLEYEGKKQTRETALPTYFNTGCCCFDDGDITGIEIAEGALRLVKWENKSGIPQRMVLEECLLEKVFERSR